MCSKRRMPSNTPIEALAVLNDPAFHEASQALGRRMAELQASSIADRIAFGYRATTSRHITDERLSELTALFEEIKQTYQADPTLAKEMADDPGTAAFAVVASVLLNLDETVSR